MNKKELISNIVAVLREKNIKKPVTAQKTVLHISDDNGVTRDFVIKKSGTELLFTQKDVSAMVDAFVTVVLDAMKNGDEVRMSGFGNFVLNYRPPRHTLHPITGEVVDVSAHYTPKFNFSNEMRRAARLYEASLKDKGVEL